MLQMSQLGKGECEKCEIILVGTLPDVEYNR